MEIHLRIKIFGEVQGVSFRFYAAEKANESGVRGFVKNMPDGTVYAEAEGEPGALQDFLTWCHKGPEFARVERVEVEQGQVKNFSGFRIER